jgi:hypothetical protein
MNPETVRVDEEKSEDRIRAGSGGWRGRSGQRDSHSRSQQFGPYSLADLQRYVASGNILLTDVARSEGMTEAVPVGQIIGNISLPAASPPVVQPGTTSYPYPPNLAWGLVLLFSILTCGLFLIAWDIVLAIWMRQVQPASRAIYYYSAVVFL